MLLGAGTRYADVSAERGSGVGLDFYNLVILSYGFEYEYEYIVVANLVRRLPEIVY